MKKMARIEKKRWISLFLTLVMFFTISGCAPKACSHNYYVADSENATGSTNGYKLYVCSECGNSYRETIPATGESSQSSNNGGNNTVQEADPSRELSVNLFDLPMYSHDWGNVKALSYCSERMDADGWNHSDCYEICGSEYDRWVRYEINGKYNILEGEIFATGSGGSGWLDFYDGDDFLAATNKVDENTVSVEFSFDISGVDYLTVYFRATHAGTWIIADDIMLKK